MELFGKLLFVVIGSAIIGLLAGLLNLPAVLSYVFGFVITLAATRWIEIAG